MAATTTLRVGVVQFAPKIGRVHANIAKAHELCKGLTPRCVDLLCFPEMIFSGYMFPNAASIYPYLEHPRTGPTCTFCAELARRLECYVTAGFPERLEHASNSAAPPPPSTSPATTATPPHNHTAGAHLPPTIVGFNTAVLYSPTGELLTLYRKSNLYETDLSWAAPGSGFTVLDLPPPLGKTTIAICNDLNVHKPAVWESLEDGPYELARHCMREGTKLLVLLNAWSKARDEADEDKDDGEAESTEEGKAYNFDDDNDGLEPNWKTLNWWAQRLRPTWAHHYPTTENENEDQQTEHQINGSEPRDLVVVACNRFGDEGERTFVGSSAMLMMCRGSGRPRLLHAMGEREEGIGIWTVPVRP
ncbi:carbon-nitrogen hydrolase [Pisolithus marmoratus]|nr:carbon-nitrogen hydrolase [Pisolithus marmoratus]